MHSRRPVYALLFAGALVVAVLTAYPYTLTRVRQAGWQLAQRVQETLGESRSPALEAVALTPPPVPIYDAATWYGVRGEAPEGHGVFVQSFDGRRVYASLNADTTYNPASRAISCTTRRATRRITTA